MSFWDEKEAKGLFRELPFYNTFIKKKKKKKKMHIKHRKNRFTT